jgi:hypothetical protein
LQMDLKDVLSGKHLRYFHRELKRSLYYNWSNLYQYQHWMEDSFCEYHLLEQHIHYLKFHHGAVHLGISVKEMKNHSSKDASIVGTMHCTCCYDL